MLIRIVAVEVSDTRLPDGQATEADSSLTACHKIQHLM